MLPSTLAWYAYGNSTSDDHGSTLHCWRSLEGKLKVIGIGVEFFVKLVQVCNSFAISIYLYDNSYNEQSQHHSKHAS